MAGVEVLNDSATDFCEYTGVIDPRIERLLWHLEDEPKKDVVAELSCDFSYEELHYVRERFFERAKAKVRGQAYSVSRYDLDKFPTQSSSIESGVNPLADIPWSMIKRRNGLLIAYDVCDLYLYLTGVEKNFPSKILKRRVMTSKRKGSLKEKEKERDPGGLIVNETATGNAPELDEGIDTVQVEAINKQGVSISDETAVHHQQKVYGAVDQCVVSDSGDTDHEVHMHETTGDGLIMNCKDAQAVCTAGTAVATFVEDAFSEDLHEPVNLADSGIMPICNGSEGKQAVIAVQEICEQPKQDDVNGTPPTVSHIPIPSTHIAETVAAGDLYYNSYGPTVVVSPAKAVDCTIDAPPVIMSTQRTNTAIDLEVSSGFVCSGEDIPNDRLVDVPLIMATPDVVVPQTPMAMEDKVPVLGDNDNIGTERHLASITESHPNIEVVGYPYTGAPIVGIEPISDSSNENGGDAPTVPNSISCVHQVHSDRIEVSDFKPRENWDMGISQDREDLRMPDSDPYECLSSRDAVVADVMEMEQPEYRGVGEDRSDQTITKSANLYEHFGRKSDAGNGVPTSVGSYGGLKRGSECVMKQVPMPNSMENLGYREVLGVGAGLNQSGISTQATFSSDYPRQTVRNGEDFARPMVANYGPEQEVGVIDIPVNQDCSMQQVQECSVNNYESYTMFGEPNHFYDETFTQTYSNSTALNGSCIRPLAANESVIFGERGEAYLHTVDPLPIHYVPRVSQPIRLGDTLSPVRPVTRDNPSTREPSKVTHVDDSASGETGIETRKLNERDISQESVIKDILEVHERVIASSPGDLRQSKVPSKSNVEMSTQTEPNVIFDPPVKRSEYDRQIAYMERSLTDHERRMRASEMWNEKEERKVDSMDAEFFNQQRVMKCEIQELRQIITDILMGHTKVPFPAYEGERFAESNADTVRVESAKEKVSDVRGESQGNGNVTQPPQVREVNQRGANFAMNAPGLVEQSIVPRPMQGGGKQADTKNLQQPSGINTGSGMDSSTKKKPSSVVDSLMRAARKVIPQAKARIPGGGDNHAVKPTPTLKLRPTDNDQPSEGSRLLTKSSGVPQVKTSTAGRPPTSTSSEVRAEVRTIKDYPPLPGPEGKMPVCGPPSQLASTPIHKEPHRAVSWVDEDDEVSKTIEVLLADMENDPEEENGNDSLSSNGGDDEAMDPPGTRPTLHEKWSFL